MFEKILYPTDFSAVSRKAIEYIAKLKDAGTREIVVIHVVDWEADCIEKLPANLKADLQSELKKEAKKELERIKSVLEQSGFAVKLRIEIGKPYREILKAETEENVSAIVLGSHGKSNIKEVFLGSVSENIIRKSLTPVLVIKR